MTDIELLPLPEGESSSFGNYEVHTNETMTDYARANIEHHTAPLRAEIVRLTEALEFQSALKKNLLPYQDEAVASRAEIEALRRELDRLRGEHVRVRRDRNAKAARAEMNDLIGRLRSLGDEAADALEEMRLGLRYAVRVWVLSDEIDLSEEEIDKAVERTIDAAKKEAGND